jgi:hypothetical protein
MSIFYGMGGMSFDNADSGAGSAARSAQSSVAEMEKRIGRLEMVCEAMWTLLREQTGMTDDDLMGMMAELDLSDGQADGQKGAAGPRDCPKCGRPNNPKRHDYCIYCGELLRTSPF